MNRPGVPDLTDLAFEGRNKLYGAYRLKKNYYKYLVVSFVIGVIIILMAVLYPFLVYYIDPAPLQDDDFLYEVEYMAMDVPSQEDYSQLLRALAQKPDDQAQTPVVVDSVVTEKEEPPKEEKMEIRDEKGPTSDSIDQPGGSGFGSGTGDDTGLASVVDVNPRFPGGDDARLYYLRQNIRYPDEAVRNRIQGVVMVVFVVETDGSISRVKVAGHLGGGCDEEAMRVTRAMPRWEPGKRNGKPVRVLVRMPIVFRIPGM